LDKEKAWHEALRERRLIYGVRQRDLAEMVGITNDYYSRIELGKRIPSQDLQNTIEFELEKFNPEVIEILFDYMRVRFPTQDARHVVESILGIKMKRMIHEDYAFYGYNEQFYFGDIVVMLAVDEKKGTLIELKGKGCRQFEHILQAQCRDWYTFLNDCQKENAVFKRIDIAVNDKVGILSIPELTRKCQQEECITIFHTFEGHQSGEFLRGEKFGMGNTLYIGSKKSEVYFCVYEKDYEQYKKNGIEIEDATVKNRFEIRLKSDRAQHAVWDLLEFRDVEKTVFEIINRYVRFVDKAEGVDRSEWDTNKQWLWFIGDGRGELRLTTKPEPYSFERSMYWLRHQVAPTLKMALVLDSIRETDLVNDMIRNTQLKGRHEKILEQQSLPVEEVII